MGLRKKFAGKADFKGNSFVVIESAPAAYLIEMRNKKTALMTYMVIDNNGRDEFPHNEGQLKELQPYRHRVYVKAKDEFVRRKVES